MARGRRVVVEEEEEDEVEMEEVAESGDDEDQYQTTDEVISVTQLMSEIETNLPIETVSSDLEEFFEYMDSTDYMCVVKYFNSLASVTAAASSFADWPARFNIARTLLSCAGALKDAVVDQAATAIELRSQEQRVDQNPDLIKAVSMFVIIAQRITVQLQLEVTKRQRDAFPLGRRGKKTEDLDKDSEQWLRTLRDQMISTLCELLQLSVVVNNDSHKNCIKYVWVPPVADVELMKVAGNTVLGLLDDPDCVRHSSQVWVRKAFRLFKILVLEFNMMDELAKGLIEKTLSLEYLRESTVNNYPFIEPLIFLGYNPESKTLKPFIERLIMFTCTVCSSTPNIARPGSLLIQSLGEHVPDLLIPHLHSLLKLLESQTIRSAVLTAFADVLRCDYLSETNCKMFDRRRAIKDVIFNTLEACLRDSNGLIRAKVIHLMDKLAQEDKIPASALENAFIAQVGKRINDKLLNVRRSALQFLCSFLTYNKYGHDFDYKSHLAKLHRLITEKASMEDPEMLATSTFTRKWMSLEPHILKNFEELLRKHHETPIVADAEYDAATVLPAIIHGLTTDTANPVHAYFIFLLQEDKIPEINDANLRDDVKKGARTLTNMLNEVFMLLTVQAYMRNDEQRANDETKKLDHEAKIIEKGKQIAYLKNKLCVEGELAECVKVALQRLYAAEPTEIKDCIKFLALCKNFGVRGAAEAGQKMCDLVWRNDNDLRKELLDCASEMTRSKNTHQKTNDDATFVNLMLMANTAQEADRISVEQVLYLLASQKEFSNGVINKLWKTAQMDNQRRSVVSLRVLGILALTENHTELIRSKLRTLQKLLLSASPIAFEALRVIAALAPSKQNYTTPEEILRPIFAIPNTDSIFRSIQRFVFKEMYREDNEAKWFSVLQVALQIFFNIAKDVDRMLPEFVAQVMYKLRRSSEFFLFYDKAANDSTGSRKEVAKARRDYWAQIWLRIAERAVALAGELAIRIVVYAQETLPRIHRKYEAMMKYAVMNESKIVEIRPRLVSEIEYNITRKKAVFTCNLVHAQGESEEEIRGVINSLLDKRVLRETRLLGRLFPIVCYAVRARGAPERLRHAAALAYGKIMNVCRDATEYGGHAVYTMLSRYPTFSVRASLLGACADLTTGIPNLADLYVTNLYKMCRDNHPAVREAALLVLSYVLTNGMTQPRGALADAARCLVDDDDSVQTVARGFFSDFAKKEDHGHGLIDLFPSFISRLSAGKEKLAYVQFKPVFEYLTVLVREKKTSDALMETLLRKLCSLEATLTTDSDAAKYFSFCISQLGLSDRTFVKLQELVRSMASLLLDAEVNAHMVDVLEKYARNAKNELKTSAETLVKQFESIPKDGINMEILTSPKRTPKARRRKVQKEGESRSQRITKRKVPDPSFSDSD